MTISSGAAILGAPDFNYARDANMLAEANRVKKTHDKLIAAGYVFVGFHGTTQSAAESLIRGSLPRASILNCAEQDGGAYWDGFYVTNSAEYAMGYTVECDAAGKRQACAFIRAYLPKSKAVHFFMHEKAINYTLNKNAFRRLVTHKFHVEKDEFLLAGPDSEGKTEHEMVISKALLPHLVFLPSLHGVTFEYHRPKFERHATEAAIVSIDIHKRRNF